MKLKTALHFFAAYMIPYVLLSLAVIDKGTVKAFLGMALLIVVGAFGAVKLIFFQAAAMHAFGFKLLLFVVCICAIALFVFGFIKRSRLWGKLLNAVGFYVWCGVGFIALAPSA